MSHFTPSPHVTSYPFCAISSPSLNTAPSHTVPLLPLSPFLLFLTFLSPHSAPLIPLLFISYRIPCILLPVFSSCCPFYSSFHAFSCHSPPRGKLSSLTLIPLPDFPPLHAINQINLLHYALLFMFFTAVLLSFSANHPSPHIATFACNNSEEKYDKQL